MCPKNGSSLDLDPDPMDLMDLRLTGFGSRSNPSISYTEKGLVKNPRYANSGDTCYGIVSSYSESRFWQNIAIGTQLTASVHSPSNTQI